MYPAKESDISQSPLINDGYTCADGGILNTEFLSTAGSRLDSFVARPSALAGIGKVIVVPIARAAAGDKMKVLAISRRDVLVFAQEILSATDHNGRETSCIIRITK